MLWASWHGLFANAVVRVAFAPMVYAKNSNHRNRLKRINSCYRTIRISSRRPHMVFGPTDGVAVQERLPE